MRGVAESLNGARMLVVDQGLLGWDTVAVRIWWRKLPANLIYNNKTRHELDQL